jgi:hypothetical protein
MSVQSRSLPLPALLAPLLAPLLAGPLALLAPLAPLLAPLALLAPELAPVAPLVALEAPVLSVEAPLLKKLEWIVPLLLATLLEATLDPLLRLRRLENPLKLVALSGTFHSDNVPTRCAMRITSFRSNGTTLRACSTERPGIRLRAGTFTTPSSGERKTTGTGSLIGSHLGNVGNGGPAPQRRRADALRDAVHHDAIDRHDVAREGRRLLRLLVTRVHVVHAEQRQLENELLGLVGHRPVTTSPAPAARSSRPRRSR